MSDEEKHIPPGTDGDPGETEALKDFLSPTAPKSGGQADKNVFAQNLFGAPPPPPRAPSQPKPAAQETSKAPPPTARPEQPPIAAMPEPAPTPPTPPAPEPEAEENIKIVTSDYFEKFSADEPAPEPAEPPVNGFTVKGAPAVNGEIEGMHEEEDFPEVVAPATEVEAAPAQEPEPQEMEPAAAPPAAEEQPSLESWELESPVDESRPIEEAIGEMAPVSASADEMPLKSDGTPVVLKAAKAKEGSAAIEQARVVIEKLDGLGEGFLDVGEVKRGLKALADLIKRVEALEARLK